MTRRVTTEAAVSLGLLPLVRWLRMGPEGRDPGRIEKKIPEDRCLAEL